MWFGAGYAQAEDRMVQLELVRRTVEGTLSAIGGPGELAQDEDIRTFFYTPGELQAQYRSMPAATRAALKAFSDGINAYETVAFKPQNQQARVPYEFFVIGSLLGSSGPYQPAPWRPIDTVAIGDYLAREFGGGGGNELSNLAYLRYLSAYLTSTHDPHPAADARAVFNDTLWINDPTAPTTVPSAATASSTSSKSTTLVATEASLAALASITTHDILQAAATLRADRERILQTGVQLKVPSHGGSNAFVVSPFKSKDHHALLWGAPQEGFGTPSIDYEEYLHGPNYDAGGMAITGEPFLLIGRNADLAWTTTSEELVDQRIYTEQVQVRATPPSYYYDGKWTPLQVVRESIPVLGSKPVHYTVYRTIDGPIFYLDAKDGVAFSMRFASWEHETGSLVGFSQLGGDTNLHQFAASMKLVTTLHNFLYADRRGNIAYFGEGLVPRSTRACRRSATELNSGPDTCPGARCRGASTQRRVTSTTGTPNLRRASTTSRTTATSIGARSSARHRSPRCWRRTTRSRCRTWSRSSTRSDRSTTATTLVLPPPTSSRSWSRPTRRSSPRRTRS
jgi:penicillin amidase